MRREMRDEGGIKNEDGEEVERERRWGSMCVCASRESRVGRGETERLERRRRDGEMEMRDGGETEMERLERRRGGKDGVRSGIENRM